MAQVYSLNVVGYVNLPVVEGFQMLANPLDLDGTGTNNFTTSVFSNSLPKSSTVYAWDHTIVNWKIASFSKAGAWSGDISLNPGLGFWLNIPAGGLAGTSSNLTVVGTVLQGSLVNPYLAKGGGFATLGSQVPIAGKVATDLKYSPVSGDTFYFWNPSITNWVIASFGKGGWAPSEPTVGIGQGFWLNSQASSTWSNYFTVQ